MGKFQFNDNSIRLDIAGHLYRVSFSDLFLARIKAMGLRLIESSKKLQQEADGAKAIEKAIQIAYDEIDGILGEGASAAIFADRERDLFDAVDVINYISGELEKFKKSKEAQLSGKKTGNKK